MAQNETGIEYQKSEHVFTSIISRATTLSADFIGYSEVCGQEVCRQKVPHVNRLGPVI